MSAINPTTNRCCTPAAKRYTEVACTGVLVMGMIAAVALSIISLSSPQLLGKFAFPPGKAVTILAGNGILLTLFTIFTIAINCPSPRQSLKSAHGSQLTVGREQSPQGSQGPVKSKNSDTNMFITLDPLNLPKNMSAYDAQGHALTHEQIRQRISAFSRGFLDNYTDECWSFESESTIPPETLQQCLNLLVSTNEELLNTPLSKLLPLTQSAAREILCFRINFIEMYHFNLLPKTPNSPLIQFDLLSLRDFWSIRGDTLLSSKDESIKKFLPFISSAQFATALTTCPNVVDALVYTFDSPHLRELMALRLDQTQVTAKSITPHIAYFQGAFVRRLPLRLLNDLPWADLVSMKDNKFWSGVFYLPQHNQNPDPYEEQEFPFNPITAREFTRLMLTKLTPQNYAIIVSKLTPEQQALRTMRTRSRVKRSAPTPSARP